MNPARGFARSGLSVAHGPLENGAHFRLHGAPMFRSCLAQIVPDFRAYISDSQCRHVEATCCMMMLNELYAMKALLSKRTARNPGGITPRQNMRIQ
jgi:hypothetical protein